MEAIKNLYLRFYFIVMALYVYLNKGVAYSFLVEALWLMGIILLFLNRRRYTFYWDKRIKLLLLFLIVSIIYIFKGAISYPLMDVIRDSFIFQYGWFVFIIFLFQEDKEYIWDRLFNIYKWFPIFALVNFFLLYFIPFFESFTVFGKIPIVLYKYGDMGVHLLICTILVLFNISKLSPKWKATLVILIIFNFLTLAAYSRSGMLSYIIGIFCFLYFNKDETITLALKSLTKHIPLALLIIIPIYLTVQVQENFQGRAVGFGQLKENITSLAGTPEDATLEKNVLWRLLWWGNILDYSFSKQYFATGKGLGMSLALSDEIKTSDEELRSPHNFHLNIMARFGVILFFVWMYWIYIMLKPIFKKQLGTLSLAISCIIMAFLINASFDVFLECPMGAFPFWTWVGLLFMTDAKT
jgi:hypothetical protein